jgi:hypothetical protein
MSIWYRVRDLEAARTFYCAKLGFDEAYVDDEDRWARLTRGNAEVALAEGEPVEEEAILTLDVPDVKAEANRLRAKACGSGPCSRSRGRSASSTSSTWTETASSSPKTSSGAAQSRGSTKPPPSNTVLLGRIGAFR